MLKTPGRVTMSALAITPTHLCRCKYAAKGNPPGDDNSIILCYRVSSDDDIHNLMVYPQTLPIKI